MSTESIPVGSCAIGRTKVLTESGVTDLVLMMAESRGGAQTRFVLPSSGARLVAYALLEMADEIERGSP